MIHANGKTDGDVVVAAAVTAVITRRAGAVAVARALLSVRADVEHPERPHRFAQPAAPVGVPLPLRRFAYTPTPEARTS